MNTALKLVTQRGEDVAYVDMLHNGFAIGWRGNAPAPRAGTVATMLKRADRNLIVGLDIGTSKVVAWSGKWRRTASIELLGLAHSPRGD